MRHPIFFLLLTACTGDLGIQPLGGMEVTATADAGDFVTSDGWNVTFNRVLVNIREVSVSGADGLSAATSSAQIVDLKEPGSKSLLSATLRTARTWEQVQLQIGPTEAEEDEDDETLVEPVDDAERDRKAMQKDGLSIYVDATLTRADTTKKVQWGFTTDTLYKDCEGGLVVPVDGTGSADIGMSPQVLFAEVPGGPTRADPIVLADADHDDTITLDELRTVPLEGEMTLGGLVEQLSRSLVQRYRDAGKCTAVPSE
jgi:hypothetical protein